MWQGKLFLLLPLAFACSPLAGSKIHRKGAAQSVSFPAATAVPLR
jgi:hypothetical protein